MSFGIERRYCWYHKTVCQDNSDYAYWDVDQENTGPAKVFDQQATQAGASHVAYTDYTAGNAQGLPPLLSGKELDNTYSRCHHHTSAYSLNHSKGYQQEQ